MSAMVTGLYDSPAKAAAAVYALEAEGVPADDISMVAGEDLDRNAFAIDSHSKLPEGVAVGATTGGAIGALLAGLTATGVVASGGAALLVAGPVVAALAGAGAGAAAGGALGALVGVAFPEHEAKFYEDAINKGSVLIGVHCEDTDARNVAKRVLKSAGAMRISTA